MKFKEVTVEKFNALMAKNITLRACPKCQNYGGQIIIDFKLYGKEGAFCRCYQCGYETKRRMTNIVISDKRKRIATPIIDKSLIGAIRQAVNDYNKKERENEQR